MYKTIRIAETELGLQYRDGVFKGVLTPGKTQRVMRLFNRNVVQVLDLRPLPVRSLHLETLDLTHPDVVRDHFVVADTGDTEVALVFEDGKLVDLIGPGLRRFYAKALYDIEIRVIDAIADFEVPQDLVAPLESMGAGDVVRFVKLPASHVGLLFVDGEFQRQLAPGHYAFFDLGTRVTTQMYDLRLQTLDVTGQEVLTKDRIGLRANVTAVYRVADPVKAASVTADLQDYLYRELQFSLRQVIGTRTLEEALGDKQGINEAIADLLVPQLEGNGLEVTSTGVKDIILPGDVRELMNRVIEAEKTAQANVIKRREETAATRSLLNTAKLMDDNPTLMRLKELEALEKVSEKVGNVIVSNGMDGVLDGLVRLAPRDE